MLPYTPNCSLIDGGIALALSTERPGFFALLGRETALSLGHAVLVQ